MILKANIVMSCGMVCCQFEAVEAVHAEEPFLLMTDIRCSAPWAVDIKTSSAALV